MISSCQKKALDERSSDMLLHSCRGIRVNRRSERKLAQHDRTSASLTAVNYCPPGYWRTQPGIKTPFSGVCLSAFRPGGPR